MSWKSGLYCVMIYDPHALMIHIDGSALNNPGGPGGIAAIAVFPERLNRGDETIFSEGFEASSNNRMELMACIKAIGWAIAVAAEVAATRVVIVTDSFYVYEGFRVMWFWRTNRWRNNAGRPLDNVDLWKEMVTLRSKTHLPISVEWQKGKSTARQREVDNEAKLSARNRPVVQDRGFRQGKIARTKLPGVAAKMFPASGRQEVVRIYRKGGTYYTGKQNCKIFFEVYSVADNSYVSKNFAYTSAETESELHRNHLYAVQFNADPKYPVIEAVLDEVVPVERTRL